MNTDVCPTSTSGCGQVQAHLPVSTIILCICTSQRDVFRYLLFHVLMVFLYAHDKCNVESTDTLGPICVC